MAFMQPDVYNGAYFKVDTTCGTEIVPCDVVGLPVPTHVSVLLQHLEGRPYDLDEVCELNIGWLARLSAPGYMDCTAWTTHGTEQEARDYLSEMYGEGE